MTSKQLRPFPRGSPADCGLEVCVRTATGGHLVALSGDLDLCSRTAATRACASLGHVDVVVDLAAVSFMDCAGYGALMAARSILERRGGSMRLIGPVGGPLRLLSLLGRGIDAPTASLECRMPPASAVAVAVAP